MFTDISKVNEELRGKGAHWRLRKNEDGRLEAYRGRAAVPVRLSCYGVTVNDTWTRHVKAPRRAETYHRRVADRLLQVLG